MKLHIAFIALLSILVSACSSTPQSASTSLPVDEARRASLLDALLALDGSWTYTMPDGEEATFQFDVSSGGSVVRETMFPGSDHEMTNMYALDGNGVVMTHYCAGGNQPSMRATELADGQLEFHFESVRDLKAPDEVYMGAMTLEFVDDDTIVEHWRAFRGSELDHENAMRLVRKR